MNGLSGKIGKFLLNQLKDGNQFAAIVSDFSKIRFDLFQKGFFLRTERYIHSQLLDRNLLQGLIQFCIRKFNDEVFAFPGFFNCKSHLFHGAIGGLNAFPQQET